MTREEAKKIARGIADKIECNTADIDDWAEFWGFTREEYEEFLDMAIKALEQEPKTGHWITLKDEWGDINEAVCSCCDSNGHHKWNYCPNCGADMREVEE